MANVYDAVAYPSSIYSQTHPDCLAVIATLSGMEPAPVQHCRVLELGCGDGFNLISMACGLPESQFVGLDLAAAPIARGNETIEKLGLKNIALRACDVMTVGAELGEFDYIIAHGFYSWVPAPVREKVMELCARNLSANGVAYISYNAYPGNHVRDLIRRMMRYHVAHFAEPAQQIRQARGLLNLLAEAGNPDDLYRHILARENERIREQSDDFFFHDDLNSHNQPFYFHEFMDDAHRHGLQFLGEAEISDKRERLHPPHVQAVLAQLDPEDVITGEQYRDFLRGRAFRWTLLCHQGIPLDHALDATHVPRLFVAGEIRPVGNSSGDGSDAAEVFRGSKDSEFATEIPLVQAAMRQIGAAWPSFVSFSDLLAQARQDVGRTGDELVEADAYDLAGAMLEAAIASGVELRAHPPHFVLEPGTHPTASALARLQLESGSRVSSLLHRAVAIDDEFSRFFLRLLDGTRDRSALRDELQAAVRSGQVATTTVTVESITDDEIDRVLRRLAKLALLVA